MIVNKLGKAECYQFILLMSDEIIMESCEILIDEDIIKIPPTEIRISSRAPNYGSCYGVIWQCSKLGLRSIARPPLNISMGRLKSLTKNIYKNKMEELRWVLRHSQGEDIYSKLNNFIYNENPHDLIRNLVFSSPSNLKKTFEILKYGNFVLPTSLENENYLIDKILWKLGFNNNLFPEYQELFWKRYDSFLDVVKTYDPLTEKEKELIRSAGVNFFVSLEEILDYSLSFITWTLLEDHFENTNFKFNFDDARIFMAYELNSVLDGTDFEYEPNGKNNLYPLIQGFKFLAGFCKKIIADEKSYRKRSNDEIPGYYGKAKIQNFPFLHKKFILDLKENEINVIIGFLEKITKKLENSKIVSIRNRIDHKDIKTRIFPNKKEIIGSVNELIKIIDEMEDFGVVPLVYIYNKELKNQFNRQKVILSNYEGEKLEMNVENPVDTNFYHKPSIIIKKLNIDSQNVSFRLVETSDYFNMWKDFHKKNIWM